MQFKKYLTTKNIIFLLLIIVTFACITQLKVISMLFFASFVIASSLNPIVDKLSKKMDRSLASSVVLFGTLTISTAVFLPIIFIAIKQVHGFAMIMPEKIEFIQNFLYNYKFNGHRLLEIINLESLIKSSQPFASGLVNQSINITMNFAQGILFFLAICMIVYYFLADKAIIKDALIKLFPPAIKEKAGDIYENISHKVGGYVIAQLLNMVAIGVITAIGLAMIKVDYSLLLGLITGVLDIIPLVGPTIALVLCLLMAYQSGWVGILLVFIVFLTAQWISNNLVRPVIFGRFLDLHPLIIIFAILVSAQFLGVWGVILSPAIASLVCVLFDEVYIKTINKSDE